MNQSHRSLFNAALGAWVAVPEDSRARASRATSARRATHTATVATTVAAVAASFLLTPLQQAIAQAQPVAADTLPTGQTVRSGTASFSTTGNVLEVNQQSARLQTDWTSFSIGRDATVKFVQPSATAVALNRVTGVDGSQILGRLEANGQVFLVNPNGVLFGNGAQVAVGSLVASTLDLSDANFRAGLNNFEGTSVATVENQGSLSAASGGAIALIGAKVINDGTITAPQGSAMLGAGNGVTLDIGGPVRLRVTQAAVQAQVNNGGVIAANGGQVLLSAQGASDLASAAINQTGTLEASNLESGPGGRIVLSTNGRYRQTGNLAANARDGAGGTIQMSAGKVELMGQAHAVSANGQGGNIQIDNTDTLTMVLGANNGVSPLTSLDVSGHSGGGAINVSAAGELVGLGATLNASSEQGAGGTMKLDAGTNAFLYGSPLTADGGSGGGRLEISGAFVSATVGLQANATRNGDGGRVDITSSGAVRLESSEGISARGAGDRSVGGTVRISLSDSAGSTIDLPVTVASGDPTGRTDANGSIRVQSISGGIGSGPSAATVAGWLDGGAHVTLVSDNDLTVSQALTTQSANSGALSLIAGRSLLVNANVGRASGGVSMVANAGVADGIRPANRLAGAADLTMAAGTSVAAPSVDVSMGQGAGVAQAQSGTITLGTVTTRDLTIRAPSITATFQSDDKVYDGTTDATGSAWSAVGLGFTADSNLRLTAADYRFADRNAGLNKTVTATAQLTGFNGTASTTIDTSSGELQGTGRATIQQRTLTATATAQDKVYDGTTLATLGSLSITPLGTDQVSVTSAGASFVDRNAGQNKSVNVTGLTLSGADRDNYVLATGDVATTATISPRTLVATVTAHDKIYDGQVTAQVSTTDNRLIGDLLTVTSGQASFADKNVGNGKQVAITGLSLTGQDAPNYQLAQTTAVSTATITPRLLTPTVVAANKTYDGSTAASITLGGDALAGDVLSVRSTSAHFVDKHVGVNKSVQIDGLYLDGIDRGNYVLSQLTAQSQASIDPRVLNAVITAQNKVYDGTTRAQIASVITDKLAGDDVNIDTRQAQFSDKNVGINKTVTVTNLGLTGADQGNYVLSAPTATTQADITARTLNLIARAQNKVYDGTTTAVVSLADDRVIGDALQVNHQSANFADRQAGREKRVLIDGISLTGADKDNYVVVSSAVDHADITPRTLNVVVHAQNKVYDGQVRADVSLSDDRVQGDLLTVDSRGASFDNKNVGVGKTVTVQGVSISGADQDNYRVALTTVQGTADITPRMLQVAAAASDKVYDGQVRATLTGLTDDRVSGDALQVSADDARFADKQVGVSKQVTVSGLNLSGVDAGNYRVQQDPITTTASISARQLQVQATVNGKVYDGQVGTTVRGLTDDRVAGDVLVLSASGANFDDKNVGIGKNATVQGLQVAGADSLNYVLQSQPVVAQADVTPRLLTVRATAQDKVYDSLTTAQAGLQDDRVQGDQLVVNQISADFSDKRAGRDKTVTVAGLSLSGADGGNYQLAQSQVVTQASITPRPIAVTVVPAQKDEDGTGLATVSVTTAPLPGDQAGAQWTGARFDNERPGVNKQVTVSGISLVGADADNYELARTVETVGGGVIRPQQVLQGVQSGCSASGAAATCSAGTWLLDLNLASQSLIGTQGSLSLEDIDPTTGRPRPETEGRDGAEGRLPKRLKQQGDGIQLPLEAKQNRP